MSSFGFVLSFVKKKRQSGTVISQPKKMLRADRTASKNGFAFCAATKHSTFRNAWTLFFYAQSINKNFCAKHFHRILNNNCATYSLVFITSQTIFTDFFGLLKTSENLAFLKTKRTKKFPLSISVSDWRLSYNVSRLHVRCGQISEKVKADENFSKLSTLCGTQNPAMACSRCCRMAIGILKKCRA